MEKPAPAVLQRQDSYSVSALETIPEDLENVEEELPSVVLPLQPQKQQKQPWQKPPWKPRLPDRSRTQVRPRAHGFRSASERRTGVGVNWERGGGGLARDGAKAAGRQPPPARAAAQPVWSYAAIAEEVEHSSRAAEAATAGPDRGSSPGSG